MVDRAWPEKIYPFIHKVQTLRFLIRLKLAYSEDVETIVQVWRTKDEG